MVVSFISYIIEHGLQKAARMRFIGHNLFGDKVGADGEADDGDGEKVSAQCDKVSARNDKAAETMAGSTKKLTGICTVCPGFSTCSVKQKHSILSKNPPAWYGVTL